MELDFHRNTGQGRTTKKTRPMETDKPIKTHKLMSRSTVFYF